MYLFRDVMDIKHLKWNNMRHWMNTSAKKIVQRMFCGVEVVQSTQTHYNHSYIQKEILQRNIYECTKRKMTNREKKNAITQIQVENTSQFRC